MIRAVLRKDKGHWIGCSVRGHSDYAEEGSDIVCSAVSTLSITCVNALEAVCGIEPIVEELEDGVLVFSLPTDLTEEQRHDAGILMGALHWGLKDLAEQYPNDIQLILNGGK